MPDYHQHTLTEQPFGSRFLTAVASITPDRARRPSPLLILQTWQLYNKTMTQIRPATPADIPQVLAFIQGLALYLEQPDAVHATEERLLADGFGPRPYFGCLLAERDGRPVGLSLYFFSYSTWAGTPGLYVEDLFVLPECRGLGLGKALLEATAAVAVEHGCSYMHWQVFHQNLSAMDFYRSLGANFADEWRNVRLSNEPLQKMAATGALRLSANGGQA